MGWTRLGLRLGAPAMRARTGRAGLFEALVQVVQAAEGAGFDCLWLPAPPPGLRPAAEVGDAGWAMPDPYVLAAALAQRSSTIRLGCLETPVTARMPSLLAKLATSLDVLSGGRAAVGCEAGSAAPAAFGEALAVIEAMLHRDAPTLSTGHFVVNEAWNEPRLRDGPGPRLAVRLAAGGGGGDGGVLRAVARLCDGCAVDAGDPALAARVAGVRAAAEAAQRELAVIGVVPAGGGPSEGGIGDGTAASARAAVGAGCDALVADLGHLPSPADLGSIAGALSAVLR